MTMTVWGLTGNIGCGKSTVGKMLAKKGFHHIDADQIGRSVAEPGMPANLQLQKAFGKEYFDEQGNLLRKKLGEYVFSDNAALRKLNDITHPAINAEIVRQIKKIQNEHPDDHIVLEAAVLFESGMENLVDSVVLVFADDDVRLKRVMERDGLAENLVRDRMNSQMSQEEKRMLSQYVIHNNGNLDDLNIAVSKFIESI